MQAPKIIGQHHCCVICKAPVVKNLVQCTKCNHAVSHLACLDKKIAFQCPQCKGPWSGYFGNDDLSEKASLVSAECTVCKFPGTYKQVEEHMKNIHVPCKHDGCSFSATLETKKKHEIVCPHAIITCSTCSQNIKRGDHEVHNTVVNCKNLGESQHKIGELTSQLEEQIIAGKKMEERCSEGEKQIEQLTQEKAKKDEALKESTKSLKVEKQAMSLLARCIK